MWWYCWKRFKKGRGWRREEGGIIRREVELKERKANKDCDGLQILGCFLISVSVARSRQGVGTLSICRCSVICFLLVHLLSSPFMRYLHLSVALVIKHSVLFLILFLSFSFPPVFLLSLSFIY